jgi:hypothetical protein
MPGLKRHLFERCCICNLWSKNTNSVVFVLSYTFLSYPLCSLASFFTLIPRTPCVQHSTVLLWLWTWLGPSPLFPVPGEACALDFTSTGHQSHFSNIIISTQDNFHSTLYSITQPLKKHSTHQIQGYSSSSSPGAANSLRAANLTHSQQLCIQTSNLISQAHGKLFNFLFWNNYRLIEVAKIMQTVLNPLTSLLSFTYFP